MVKDYGQGLDWERMSPEQKKNYNDWIKEMNKEEEEAKKFKNRLLKIIFTKEDRKTARKKITGFRQSYIIDVRELVLEFDYQPGQEVSSPHEYIINKELEKRMAQALVNKKSQQIIYFHFNLNPDIVKNVKTFFKINKAKVEYYLYDPRDEFKKMKRLFNEVLK